MLPASTSNKLLMHVALLLPFDSTIVWIRLSQAVVSIRQRTLDGRLSCRKNREWNANPANGQRTIKLGGITSYECKNNTFWNGFIVCVSATAELLGTEGCLFQINCTFWNSRSRTFPTRTYKGLHWRWRINRTACWELQIMAMAAVGSTDKFPLQWELWVIDSRIWNL